MSPEKQRTYLTLLFRQVHHRRHGIGFHLPPMQLNWPAEARTETHRSFPGVLAFVALLTAVAPSLASDAGGLRQIPVKQMLDVVKRSKDGVIHIFVRNREPTDVTATFSADLVNMKGSTRFPVTRTFPPNQTIEAFSLAPVHEDEEWHYTLTNCYLLGSLNAVHDDTVVYHLPYEAGRSFTVSQGFNGAFSHTGPERYAIDWTMPEGTPVLAARSGVVVGVEQNSTVGGADRKFENRANYILIQHSDGTIGNYAHLLSHGAKVRVGQSVETGDVIGLSGNTGFSSGPHLHFSVFKAKNGKERESIPIKFLTTNGSAILQSGEAYLSPKGPPATRMAAGRALN